MASKPVLVDDDEELSPDEQIEDCVKYGENFMLFGLSGTGKSQRVKQVDPDLTFLTLVSNMLPEQVIGKMIFPEGFKEESLDDPKWFKEYFSEESGRRPPNWYLQTEGVYNVGARWVAPEWYNKLVEKCAKEPDKKHVLFIDEVTNAGPHTQSLIYHIVLDHSIAPNQGKLPPNCVVALAGNNKSETSASRGLPAPLFRRLSKIYIETDMSTTKGKENFKDWIKWGSEKETGPKNRKETESGKHDGEIIDPERTRLHPLVLNFVASRAEKLFYTPWDENKEDKYALDPHIWEKVSDTIYNHVNAGERLNVGHFSKLIGKEAATSLISLCKNPPLTAEEIISKKYDESRIPNPNRPEAVCAFILSLRYLKPEQHDPVRKFIESKFTSEYVELFDSYYEDMNQNDETDLISSMGMPMSFVKETGKKLGATASKAIQKGGR